MYIYLYKYINIYVINQHITQIFIWLPNETRDTLASYVTSVDSANQNKKFHKVALLLFISSLTLPENNITTWKSISHYSMYFYFHLVYNHAKSMPTLFTVSTIPNYVNTVCYIGNLMLHVPSVDKSISN